MSRYLSRIFAGVIVFSATCSSLILWGEDQIDVLSELAEESERGVELSAIHLFTRQLPRKNIHFKSTESVSLASSETPGSVDFREVPYPPPKS
ncbi:MAG: hypothetical protein WBG42_12450 [Cryomorphaceae bacterium]